MTDVLEIPGKLEKRKKKRRSWRLAILGTTRPQGSRCWDLTTSSLLRQASRRYQEIYEKEELHSHFFIPWRGQCKVRLRPGRNNFFFKKEENTTISRKSLPGGGKEGEPNILTRPWQKRRTEDSDYASASEATIDVFFNTTERPYSCLASSEDPPSSWSFSSLWVCKNAFTYLFNRTGL